MKKAEIDSKLSELAALKLQQKILERKIASKEDEIKAYMKKKKLEILSGVEHEASYKQIVQMRIDSKRLQKEKPRIAKMYTVESSYMRFNIK